MKRISDYYPLSQHLFHLGEQGVTRTVLTFREVEDIINRELPPTARKNTTWWSNTHTEKYRKCAAWLEYGWEKKSVDLKDEKVEFQYMTK